MGDTGHHLAHLARLALKRVAQQDRRDAFRLRQLGRRLQAKLRRRDQPGLGAGEAGVTGLGGLGRGDCRCRRTL